MNNTAGMLFGRGRQPRHRTATGDMAVEWAASMHPVVEVVVLLGVGVSATNDEPAVRTGACSMSCD